MYCINVLLSHIFQEEIAKLLRFESSQSQPGESVSLPQYCSRLKAAQRDIFYLAAPRYVQSDVLNYH